MRPLPMSRAALTFLVCPQFTFVTGHFKEYQRLGDAAMGVFSDFPPPVERISIVSPSAARTRRRTSLAISAGGPHVDKGYRGHNHAQKFRVSGQVRRVTAPIRREMRRRAAVEPVIGHIK